MTSFAEKIDLGERFMGLDAVQNIRRFGSHYLGLLQGGDQPEKPTPEQIKVLESIDWGSVMRIMNTWYDRMATAGRIPNRAEREKEYDRIDADLAKLKVFPGNIFDLAGKDGGKVVAESLANALTGMLLPAARKVQDSHDRSNQVERNLHIAFALAAYRADNGNYPAKLDALAPKYLPNVPGDLFSGKPLIYKPEGKGYLFYSVGLNGKDEGGRRADDMPPGDDLRVRMPSVR
jgi:hypothetical protein